MTKTLYIVVDIAENGKSYAYVIKTSASNNLVSALNIPGIRSANVCDTKKQAYEIAEAWNETAKQNGSYLFLFPQF